MNQIGIGQKTLSSKNDFGFSISAICQICGGFGNTKILITKKGKKNSVIQIDNDSQFKKIKLRKSKFNNLIDSLITITNKVELHNFNNYDSLFQSLIPNEQNKNGFPNQLLRVDDGICYSITIILKGKMIKFDSCNPEAEFDLISKYSKVPHKEILDLNEGLIKILNTLRSELNIEI